MHADDSLLRKRFWWILHCKFLTLLCSEVIRNKITCSFHLVKLIKFLIYTLSLVRSFLLLIDCWDWQSLFLRKTIIFQDFLWLNCAAMTCIKRFKIALTELLHWFTWCKVFHCTLLENYRLELRSWLSSTLQNPYSYTLIKLLLIFNLLPVYFSVLWCRNVHDTKLCLVSNIRKTPVHVSLVIVCKCLLIKRVTLRHFENLREEVLLLARDE